MRDWPVKKNPFGFYELIDKPHPEDLENSAYYQKLHIPN
jgi:hypothetical protein